MRDNDVDKNIKRAANILLEQYERTGDEDNIVNNKEKVLGKYGRIFSQANISRLQIKEFEEFLTFKENKHWRSLQRQKNWLRKHSEEEIKDKLSLLLDESQDIVKRIDNFFEIKGMKKAITTPILLVAYPNSYGVWNEISEWGLKTLGLWLITYENKSREKLSEGTVYKYVNDVLVRLSKEMNVDLWTLDAILWYYHKHNKDKISLSLQEMKEYLLEDLSNIFTPEFEFKSQSGKWGGTGVVSVDLGARKDYFLLSTKELTQKLIEPEEISNDGYFDWATQERMRDGENPMVQALKENNPEKHRVLLFAREKGGSNFPYTYYGPLEFVSEHKDVQNNRRFVFRLQSWDLISKSNFALGNPLIGDSKTGIKAKLIKEEAPNFDPQNNYGVNNQNRIGKISANYNYEENKIFGDGGEKLVLEYEKEKLKEHPELLSKISHISKENDNAGYDILSFTENGEEMLIEVKTTPKGKNTPFYLSSNEFKTAMNNVGKYYIYRVYEYNPYSNSKFYVLSGKLDEYNHETYTWIFSPNKT